MHTYIYLDQSNRKAGPDHIAPSNSEATNGTGTDKFVPIHASGGRNRLRRLSMRIKSKLHPEDSVDSNVHNDQPEPDTKTLAPILAPPPSSDVQGVRFTEAEEHEPVVPRLKEWIHKPLETAKGVANKEGGKEFAKNVANTVPGHGESVKLVLAHEKIAASAGDAERKTAEEHFESSKKIRQDAYVRWTMGRHVRRVRNVEFRTPKPPSYTRKDFVWSEGDKEKMHWLDYGQYVRLTLLYVFHTAPRSPFISTSKHLTNRWTVTHILFRPVRT